MFLFFRKFYIKLKKSTITNQSRQNHSKTQISFIILKYGWCVGVYDVSHVSDPLIMHGTGSQLVDTVFRLIVFKPFVGEVLLGTVVDCDLEKG